MNRSVRWDRNENEYHLGRDLVGKVSGPASILSERSINLLKETLQRQNIMAKWGCIWCFRQVQLVVEWTRSYPRRIRWCEPSPWASERTWSCHQTRYKRPFMVLYVHHVLSCVTVLSLYKKLHHPGLYNEPPLLTLPKGCWTLHLYAASTASVQACVL